MPLVVISSPETESELAIAVSLLDAHEIPHIIHNEGFGGLFPGLQINACNNRRVMVPLSYAEEAIAVLSVLSQDRDEPIATESPGLPSKLRIIFEALFFGWFVPKRRPTQSEERA